jgi:hypothetical protein
MACTKTCAPGSTLNIKQCLCEQKNVGRKDYVFDPQTGRFNKPLQPVEKVQPVQPVQRSGGSVTDPGSVIKGNSLRRQASNTGLRTSKKHK